MPRGTYLRHSNKEDMRTIAQLLQGSKSMDDFYAKMHEVYKNKYTLQNVIYYWKDKSKIIPRNLIETHTVPATGPTNASLKDAETYLSEIVNEMRLCNRIQQEVLALFKRLEEKPRETK